MNDGNSIVEFFYNIVPGSLFIILLRHLFYIDLLSLLPKRGNNDDTVIIIFAYIIMGLFLGFIFQGIIKFIRELGFNKWIAKKVIADNKKEFAESNDVLGKKYKTFLSTVFERNFYLMDNYLRGKHAAFLPTHNSSRFAFWSNIFLANLFLIGLMFMRYPCLNFYHLFFIIVLLASAWWMYKYFYAFYDTILKSYFMEQESKRTGWHEAKLV